MTETSEEPLLEHQLTVCLLLFLARRAREAWALSQKWTADSWVARCVSFLCDSWYLFEPSRPTDVFGGIERVQSMMESECVEKYFLSGHSALLRKDPVSAVSAFRNAMLLAPQDPYVSVSLALAYSGQGQHREAADLFSRLKASRPNHPIIRAFRFDGRQV
jgi:hypothetical protein